ncbi:MAG: hypothetical protein JSS87_00445 [Acidobacteria bacterium]|nr:hypothetical protein [Acidobacteriota bacterium]
MAQEIPTAQRTLRLSAFSGITGSHIGLASGRNLGITAGADAGFRQILHVNPAIEVRGTHVIDKGSVAGENNVLGGLRIGRAFGRLHPYGDILAGFGQIYYNGNGYPTPDGSLIYKASHSMVLSPGGGVDIAMGNRFSLKVDLQWQRYGTPVTESGHMYTTAGTAGIVYHFNF